jgi:hypothetical protein
VFCSVTDADACSESTSHTVLVLGDKSADMRLQGVVCRCTPSQKILAQVGSVLERGEGLAGRLGCWDSWLTTCLVTWSSTPLEKEAGRLGWWDSWLPTCLVTWPSTPLEKEAGRLVKGVAAADFQLVWPVCHER